MIRINCPFCGERDHSEFTYSGDATKVRPAHGSTDMEAWLDYVYLRANPKGSHTEFWHHVHGCRQWLVVERDTTTHEVLNVAFAKPLKSGGN
ncbi:MAG: sarcosine oxidase subunit delta [Pseudomonadota bacterium]|nr:sarcosine oxidase subunit delta [Pseudomonadota bacterium]